MIWHLFLKPIVRLLVAIIGEERLDRTYDRGIIPVMVVIGIATVAVTAYALVVAS